jgi:hypothetical protein
MPASVGRFSATGSILNSGRKTSQTRITPPRLTLINRNRRMTKFHFDMKPEDQRMEIAKACGCSKFTPDTIQFTARRSDGKWGLIPDYLNDLNAMHEAENLLINSENCEEYQSHLAWCDHGKYPEWRATAAQRAESFLKTLNLWEE